MRSLRPRALYLLISLLSLALSGCGLGIVPHVVSASNGDFLLSVLPSSVSLSAGAAAAPFTVNLAPSASFSAPVTIAVTSTSPSILCAEPACTLTLPAGVTSAVFHIGPAASAAPGTYTLTFTATSGAITHIAIATLAVPPPVTTPDFTFAVSPTASSVPAGTAAPSDSFTIAPINGFAAPVTITASAPAGITCSLSPCSLTTSALQVPNAIQFTPSASLIPGTYTLTFTATSGTLTHTATATLTVTAPPVPDFTFAVSPVSSALTSGTSTPGYSFTLSPSNGFSAAVTITASAPAGFTCTTSPCSLTTSSSSAGTLSFSTTPSLVPGTFTLTFTATSGMLSHTATATVLVTPPSVNIPLACGGSALPSTSPVAGSTSFVYTGETPPAALYDSLHNVVFVSNHQLGEIDVVSPNTLAILVRIPVSQPRGLDITADHSTLIVGTDTHFFYRINTTSLCVIDRNYLTGIAPNLSPMFVLALSDGSVMLQLQDISTTASGIAIWSPSTGPKQLYPGTYLNQDVGRIIRSGDHQHAFISESSNGGYIARYDVSTQKFTVLNPQFGSFANVQASNFDGSRLFYTSDCCGLTLSDASFNTLATYKTFFGAGFTLSQDGSRLYLVEGYSPAITVLDSSSLTPVGYLPAQPLPGSSSAGNLGANTADDFDGTGRILTSTTLGLKLVALDPTLLPSAAAATAAIGGITTDNIDTGNTAILYFNAPASSTIQSVTFAEGTTVLPAAATITSSVLNSPQLSLTVPTFNSGCADLTATFNFGTAGFIPHAFCYTPSVSALDGDAGPSSGGAIISIYGKGFGSHPTVRIGGSPATVAVGTTPYAVTNYEPEALTVTVPPGTPGPADITIANGIGASINLPQAFTYITRQDAALPAGATPFQLLFDHIHNRLLWTDSARNLLVVSSPATGQTIQEVPVGNKPQGLSLSPDGSRLAIATQGDRTVTLYDATTFTRIQSAVAPSAIFGAYVPLYVAIMQSGNVIVTVSPTLGLQGGYAPAAAYIYDLPSNAFLPLSSYSNFFCENVASVVRSSDGTSARIGANLYSASSPATISPLASNYDSCTQIGISSDGALNTDPFFIADNAGLRQNFYSPPSEIGAKLNGAAEYSNSYAASLVLNASGSLAYTEFISSLPSGSLPVSYLRIFDTAHGSLRSSVAITGGFTLPSLSQPIDVDPAGQQLWFFTPSGLTTLIFPSDPLAIGEVRVSGSTLTLLGSGFTSSLMVSVDGQQLPSTTSGTTSATAALPALASGTHNVTVQNPGQPPFVLPSGFKVP